jgi:hypothetical protein
VPRSVRPQAARTSNSRRNPQALASFGLSHPCLPKPIKARPHSAGADRVFGNQSNTETGGITRAPPATMYPTSLQVLAVCGGLQTARSAAALGRPRWPPRLILLRLILEILELAVRAHGVVVEHHEPAHAGRRRRKQQRGRRSSGCSRGSRRALTSCTASRAGGGRRSPPTPSRRIHRAQPENPPRLVVERRGQLWLVVG